MAMRCVPLLVLLRARRPAVVGVRHGDGEGHAVAARRRPGDAGHVVR